MFKKKKETIFMLFFSKLYACAEEKQKVESLASKICNLLASLMV